MTCLRATATTHPAPAPPPRAPAPPLSLGAMPQPQPQPACSTRRFSNSTQFDRLQAAAPAYYCLPSSRQALQCHLRRRAGAGLKSALSLSLLSLSLQYRTVSPLAIRGSRRARSLFGVPRPPCTGPRPCRKECHKAQKREGSFRQLNAPSTEQKISRRAPLPCRTSECH